MNYLLVFIGGGLGSSLRHTVNVICPRCSGPHFPYHTFIINITGSTIMGLIAGYLAFKGEASQSWRLFVMTGILGGYTTFSAFSLDAGLLYERGEVGLARALRAGVGGSVDRRPVCRACAGPPSDLSTCSFKPCFDGLRKCYNITFSDGARPHSHDHAHPHHHPHSHSHGTGRPRRIRRRRSHGRSCGWRWPPAGRGGAVSAALWASSGWR